MEEGGHMSYLNQTNQIKSFLKEYATHNFIVPHHTDHNSSPPTHHRERNWRFSIEEVEHKITLLPNLQASTKSNQIWGLKGKNQRTVGTDRKFCLADIQVYLVFSQYLFL